MQSWKKFIKPGNWNDALRFLIWGRHEFSHRYGYLLGPHAAPAKLAHRFVQHTGQIAISTVTLAELYAGAHKHSQTSRLLTLIADLLQEVKVVDFDAVCAESFGRVRGMLLRTGIAVPTTDLMIASAALVHNLTLVTHNTVDYQNIPGLRLDDWLVP